MMPQISKHEFEDHSHCQEPTSSMAIRGVGRFQAELSKDCLGWNKINHPSPKEDFIVRNAGSAE
jgi:hypothetical protein